MKKDYIPALLPGDSEVDFVQSYWTDVWERSGGPSLKFKSIQSSEEFKTINKFFKSLPLNSKTLDAGCGLGNWTVELNSLGYNTVGLDLSTSTIVQLKSLFPNVVFDSGDLRNTSFDSSSFDAYISWGVFEHFEAGPRECLTEAFRLIKPNGLLCISVPFDNLRHSFLSHFVKKVSQKPLRFYQYRFTQQELINELTISGFVPICIRPIHKRQGILRCLHHEFGLPYDWFATKALSVILQPFIPSFLVSHMLIAVARKS